MKRIAMVKDGIVENIAVWDGRAEWNPSGYELIDVTGLSVDIGWNYDGENFNAPVEGE